MPLLTVQKFTLAKELTEVTEDALQLADVQPQKMAREVTILI